MDKETLSVKFRLKEIPFLKSLPEELYLELLNCAQVQELTSGELLFSEGENSTDLYFIVSGRLGIIKSGKKINELGRGEILGEIAWLTERRRTSSVQALRDTILLKLSARLFEEIYKKYPMEFLPLIRSSLNRLIDQVPDINSTTSDFLFYFDFKNELSEKIVSLMQEGMEKYGSCKILTKEDVCKSEGEFQENYDLVDSWLIKQELSYKYLIYLGDVDNLWTNKCLRQCDRVVVFSEGDRPGHRSPEAKKLLDEARKLNKYTDLVLIHESGMNFPAETAKWIDQISEVNWHHIREGSRKDLQRVIRLITGHSFALVLGGGDAQALVYIGMYKALLELGVPVDCVAATSAGSLTGALIAMEYSTEEIAEVYKRSAPTKKAIADYTFPFISFLSGGKVKKILMDHAGTLNIEDLWRRLFVVATNITSYKTEIFYKGLLWKALRASIGMPAVFHPVGNDKGDLLVDGGVSNNLPVDVIHENIKNCVVIAGCLSKSPMSPYFIPYDRMSCWKILYRILKGQFDFKNLNIFNILHRCTMMASRMHTEKMIAHADVCISFNVNKVPLFRYDLIGELINIGYLQTMAKKETLQKLLEKHKIDPPD